MSSRRFSRVLASLMLLAVPAWAQAQTGTVTGTVTESRANTPVVGARVQALSTTTVVAATQSREDGSFRLTVPAGSYTIVVNRIGYRPGNATVTVTAGGTATATVSLNEAIIELNPVVTVASRKEEKALDAPASVSVIEVREIQERPAITAAEHVQGMAGVDVSKGGVAQSNIVVRGFNNAFNGSLLTLQDYRFAGVPSLRVNVPLMATTTGDDIERIEVLLGPASALYGPNSSHGVLHVITKSPFTSQGTQITVDGGTQSLFKGSMRHAGLIGDKLGFKLSGEYFTAKEWEYFDPAEPLVFSNDASIPAARRGQPNDRTFDIKRSVGEARVDYRPNENSEYITTIGMSKIGSGMEITGTNGAVLAKNWSYTSLQQRARIGRLFGQVFMNMSNSGNDTPDDMSGTYGLRTGQPFVDQSRVLAAQLQHGLSLGSKQDFIYGVDYISTNPRTLGTINGRNEEIDDVREVGGYLQSTTRLTPKFDFIAALRVDNNDQVDGNQVSPRAALIFKPSETQNFRATFNRAFQTPANFTWFLDLVSQRNLAPGLPYLVRAVGNPPKQGWDFNRDCDPAVNGGLCMRSIFTSDPSAWVPASAATAYKGLVAGNAATITAGLAAEIQTRLGAPANVAAGAAAQLVNYLASLNPSATDIGTQMHMLLPGSPNLAPDDVKDLDPVKASFNNTFEVGYKGIIGNKLRLAIDGWSEKRGEVGNPAGLATPNIYFETNSLKTYLQNALIPAITGALMGPPFNMPQQQAAGTAQQFAPLVATDLATKFGPAPLGIVSFDDDTFASATDILATYTSNDKEITVNGIDVALDYVHNENWTFGGTLSWVDNDSFPDVMSSNNRPLMLNAPSQKASLSAIYRATSGRWGYNLNFRHANGYQVNSGVYASNVQFLGPNGQYSYAPIRGVNIFDVGMNWRLMPAGQSVLFSVRADNVFNIKYRTMPGTPELGFLFVTRLQYSF